MMSTNYINKIQQLISIKMDLDKDNFNYLTNLDFRKSLLHFAEVESCYETVSYLLRKLYGFLKLFIKKNEGINVDITANVIKEIVNNDKSVLKLKSNPFCINFLSLVYIEIMKFDRLNSGDVRNDKIFGLVKENPSRSVYISEVLKNEGFYKEFEEVEKMEEKRLNISASVGLSAICNTSTSKECDSFSSYLQDIIFEDLPTKSANLPSFWKQNDVSKFIIYSENNLIISYLGGENKCHTIKANNPINGSIGVYYFEVEILHNENDLIAVGLASKDYIVSNNIPGWELNSIGFHSDNGHLYNAERTGKPYGPKGNVSEGDIIGCCVDFINSQVFFTKNGIAYANVTFTYTDDLYPSIGLRKDKQSVRANFGQNTFVYNIKEYIREVLHKVCFEISLTNYQTLKTYYPHTDIMNLTSELDLIKDYLLFNGYPDTLKEIYNTEFTNRRSNRINDFGSSRRKDLRNYIEAHNFHNAIEVLQSFKKDANPKSNAITQCINYLKLCEVFNKIHQMFKDSVKQIEILKFCHKNQINQTTVDNIFRPSLSTEASQTLIINDCPEISQMLSTIAAKKNTINSNLFRLSPDYDSCTKLIILIYELLCFKSPLEQIEYSSFTKELNKLSIFETINTAIMEDVYGIKECELDTIIKQTIKIVKELLAQNSIKAGFLFRKKDIISFINKYLQKNLLYSP